MRLVSILRNPVDSCVFHFWPMYIFRDFRKPSTIAQKRDFLCNCSAFFDQTIATLRYQKSENKPQKTITAGYQSENKPQQTITTVSKREHSYKKQATPKLESGLPDKDLQNAYALAFTVFQISVYLSSRASDV